MADPRFFARRGPFLLADLAGFAGAALGPGAAGDLMIVDVAPLEVAAEGEVSFFDNPRYADAFRASRAQACIVAPKSLKDAPAGMALLLSEQPYKAYARIAQAFYPEPEGEPGIHPSAIIAPGAILGREVIVGAQAVIETGAEIGDRCRIGPNAVLGRNIVLGEEGRIGAGVSLSHCLIGRRVTIHPGARIGQDGFGFAPDPAGHVKVPQLGRVLIGDDCEIGANTTIDRGSGHDTIIGANVWIDNLVQIGHNVEVGRGCIIVAQAGISGSTKLGDFVALGGQAGLAGHLHIGSGAQIAAQAGVMGDVPAGGKWCGAPAVPIRDFFRQTALLQRLVRERSDGK